MKFAFCPSFSAVLSSFVLLIGFIMVAAAATTVVGTSPRYASTFVWFGEFN
jgi:hypothetical protein